VAGPALSLRCRGYAALPGPYRRVSGASCVLLLSLAPPDAWLALEKSSTLMAVVCVVEVVCVG